VHRCHTGFTQCVQIGALGARNLAYDDVFADGRCSGSDCTNYSDSNASLWCEPCAAAG
jgi:hypothetical protein